MNTQPAYAASYDVALYQLEMAIDNKADPGQISSMADRVLPLVRGPGGFVLQQDITAVLEFQTIMAIIDRCAKRQGVDCGMVRAIFDGHVKNGYLSSLCQIVSLAVGLKSSKILDSLGTMLENSPPTVLHTVFHTISNDYLVLCPKVFNSVKTVAKASPRFAAVLVQGALMPAKQMRLQSKISNS